MSELTYQLAEDTTIALDGTVELIIAREYGATEFEGRPIAEAIAAGRELARGGVARDARIAYEAFTGGDERYLRTWSQQETITLIKARLSARECQCRQLPRGGLDRHEHRDVCHNHYEADVPPVNGLYLCGTCYCKEPDVAA